MSQINLKSISGITSITTLPGVDNQLTVHTNDTAERIKITSSGLNVTGVCTATSFSGSGANLTSLPAANLTGTLPAISGANLTSLPSQVTIANNADNRVITGGSGTNLNGESTLTYDGNTLKFGGGSAPSNTTYYNDIVIDNSDTASGAAGGGGIKIYSGNQSWGGLIFGDSDSDQVGFIKYAHSDNYLALAANGTTYMRITNAGIVSCTNSTTGFLPPKGTTAQRTGIGLTPTGMIRYNTTTNNLELYKTVDSSNEWVSITARSPNFNINYLVIGGGGAGGGNFRGGGGGSGAYRTNWNSESQGGGQSSGASKPISVGTAYSIVIGAAGGGNAGTAGGDGGQSKFDNITADGGGGGGYYNGYVGRPSTGNGSGGGGGSANGAGGASGTYGYNGGSGGGVQCGGGGGGAAAVGNNGGSGGTSGDGGTALANTITGSSVLRAGGGGGGAYGSGNNFPIGGGGGAGNGRHDTYNNGLPATANTGSGGGGASGDNNGTGGSGGSGIVILRFSTDYTIALSGGITSSSTTIGNETVVTITATSDSSQTVTFS